MQITHNCVEWYFNVVVRVIIMSIWKHIGLPTIVINCNHNVFDNYISQ